MRPRLRLRLRLRVQVRVFPSMLTVVLRRVDLKTTGPKRLDRVGVAARRRNVGGRCGAVALWRCAGGRGCHFGPAEGPHRFPCIWSPAPMFLLFFAFRGARDAVHVPPAIIIIIT